MINDISSVNILKSIKPQEGEIRNWKDGDYKFEGGKWKKVKLEGEEKKEERKPKPPAKKHEMFTGNNLDKIEKLTNMVVLGTQYEDESDKLKEMVKDVDDFNWSYQFHVIENYKKIGEENLNYVLKCVDKFANYLGKYKYFKLSKLSMFFHKEKLDASIIKDKKSLAIILRELVKKGYIPETSFESKQKLKEEDF